MAAVASLDDLPPDFMPDVPNAGRSTPAAGVPMDLTTLRFPLDSPTPPRTEALRSWLTPRLALPLRPLAHRTDAGTAAGTGALMYHRFSDPVPGLPRPTWNVPPSRLHAQLSGVLALGYRAVRLEEALDRLAAGEPTEPKTFVVTIDDGYLNNLTRGLPIFESLRVPVTLFVATGYLGSSSPYPFDDWAGKGCPTAPRESWAPMSRDDLSRFADSAYVSLGAHTHTHQDFRGRPELFAADVTECCRVLRHGYGVERPPLAFPYGTRERGFSGGELKAAAERTPVRCGLTTADESIRVGADPFDLGRFTATASDTAATLAAKLDGRFGALKRLLGRDGAPAPAVAAVKPTPDAGGRS
ncbi:polysaccharide deacetylase family protein [Alienimonas californiensis]|uniref:Polysaccharide deacetylase n=1 Tax=Alienimonas californiensis TaxID=2527989 RepID=A0A517PEH6_9PLAN|nr:polysaccharide deacetylase family protein [Alienimonas californiensis]QDT17761.1 Polysaccharide deacetylase [Alienimonas californiensis]